MMKFVHVIKRNIFFITIIILGIIVGAGLARWSRPSPSKSETDDHLSANHLTEDVSEGEGEVTLLGQIEEKEGPSDIKPLPSDVESQEKNEVADNVAPQEDLISAVWGIRNQDKLTPPGLGEIGFVYRNGHDKGWTDVHISADHESERIWQALLGERVRVIEQNQKWSKVNFDSDLLKNGWVETSHLQKLNKDTQEIWGERDPAILVEAPGLQLKNLFIPFGARLRILDRLDGDRLAILLPDGRDVLVSARSFRSTQSPKALREILSQVKKFLGKPLHREGGNTIEAMDSAGLIWLVYRAVEVPVPRDLQQMQVMGADAALESGMEGDVLFFSTHFVESPMPVLRLGNGDVFLVSLPSSGVSLKTNEAMRNRELLATRRLIPNEKTNLKKKKEKRVWSRLKEIWSSLL